LKKICRLFVASCLSLAIAINVSSCGKTETETDEANASTGEARKLVLLSWENYMDPEAIAAFEAKAGVEVVYETFENTDELQSLLQSRPGRHDVVIVDDARIEMLAELRLLRPLDRTQILNWTNLHPDFMGAQFDPENKHSLPFMWGSTLVAYRTDKIDDPGASWNSLWNPAYRDHVYLLDERTEFFTVILKKIARPMNSSSPEDYDAVVDEFARLKSAVNPKFGSDAEVKDALRSGKAWMAMCYSGDAALIADEGHPISFFIPEEGAPLWIDNFVVPRDTLQPALAHRFIDFMLEAEQAAANSNYVWYASPNEAATPLLDPELTSDQRIYPTEEVLSRCEFHSSRSVERERLMNGAWQTVQKSIRNKTTRAVPVPILGTTQ